MSNTAVDVFMLSDTPFRFSPLKEILIYGIPIPRNLPTAPELIKNQPGVWTEEIHHVRA